VAKRDRIYPHFLLDVKTRKHAVVVEKCSGITVSDGEFPSTSLAGRAIATTRLRQHYN
jgi:hypothetical protein